MLSHIHLDMYRFYTLVNSTGLIVSSESESEVLDKLTDIAALWQKY